MFNFLKPKTSQPKADPPLAENIKLNLSGLHCSSCAVNIDLALEDLDGVTNSSTNYAKSQSNISFDPTKIDVKKIISEIKKLGYTAESLN